MKNKRTVTVIISIFALIAVGTVALYVYEIANGASPTENLTRMLATVFICAAASMRMFRGGAGKRYTLDFYEMEFAKHIRGAFAHTPALRKKLLSAVRLYSESKYNQSMKKLIDLKRHIRAEEARNTKCGYYITDDKHYPAHLNRGE